jgi:energy-coupling factor transporter transmembrane protein EcfT
VAKPYDLKAVVFVLHFFFFGLTVLFFLLKFHKRGKIRFVMLPIGILWVVFGLIDFFLGLNNFFRPRASKKPESNHSNNDGA